MSGSNQETPGPRDDRPRLCLFRPRGHTLRPTAGCDSSATPRPTVPGPRRAPAEKSDSRNLRGLTTAADELCRVPLASREHLRLQVAPPEQEGGDPYLRGPARPLTRVYPVPPEPGVSCAHIAPGANRQGVGGDATWRSRQDTTCASPTTARTDGTGNAPKTGHNTQQKKGGDRTQGKPRTKDTERTETTWRETATTRKPIPRKR